MGKLAKAFGFDHPLKSRLEAIIGLLGDIKRSQSALQLLIGPPPFIGGAGLLSQALYTQALVSYARCFASGRRPGLSKALFSQHPDLAEAHNRFKSVRDKHVAHAVDESEHVAVLVAAVDEASEALGLGVKSWFFISDDLEGLKAFLELVEFVLHYLEEKEQELGDELATTVMGTGVTWDDAKKKFSAALAYDDQVYGPIQPW